MQFRACETARIIAQMAALVWYTACAAHCSADRCNRKRGKNGRPQYRLQCYSSTVVLPVPAPRPVREARLARRCRLELVHSGLLAQSAWATQSGHRWSRSAQPAAMRLAAAARPHADPHQYRPSATSAPTANRAPAVRCQEQSPARLRRPQIASVDPRSNDTMHAPPQKPTGALPRCRPVNARP